MIENYEEYEAALERLLSHLERPLPGGQEDAEFTRLMEEIASFDPPAGEDVEHAHDLRERAKELAARAAAFQRKREERERAERLMTFPEDGQGIGPSTGV